MAEEDVHFCIMLGWNSARYLDRLRLRVPRGVLPYIKVVDELFFLTQTHQKMGTKKSKFSKKQHLFHQQIRELKQMKLIATLEQNCRSSQTAEFHPLLRVSRDHSTLQPYQLFRSLVRLLGNFVERLQSWRAIPSFYCPSFAMKRTPDMSLF